MVLGGDCSILLGSGLAMHRLGEEIGGRIGLVFVDGHSDFRHPGNASYVGAAAGEDLALVTGRGQADLAAIEGRRPYFRDIDVVVLGIREHDEYRLDLQAAGIVTRPVPTLRAEGAARTAQWARDQLVDCAGFWVHVDVDVLDPAVMPAVDAPTPGGIAFAELELLIAGLVESPHCLGVEITVFDPDYDPDGTYAAEITSARGGRAATGPHGGAAAGSGRRPQRPVGPHRRAARRRPRPGPASEPERADSVEERRAAAAAAASVSLAAAGVVRRGDGPAGRAGGVRRAGRDPARRRGIRSGGRLPGRVRSGGGRPRARTSSPSPATSRPTGRQDERPERHGTIRATSPTRAPAVNQVAPRPLGSAPLLDSEPLPATRPGMLRPRPPEGGGFSLPAQRPAFDLGPEEPADIT